MPIIDTPAGTLEVTNAILSASEFRGTQKISVSNSAPTKNFSVGDKFHVSTTDADAVNITGNLVAQKLKIGNLLVSPTFDLAAVSNVGNTTSNTLQFANATTSFVASSNVEIGGNITLTSNAQVKVGSNVLAEYTGPHGREPKEMPIKKYPEIVFEDGKFDANDSTNTYVQAGYTVTASSSGFEENGFAPWKVFNQDNGKTADNAWHTAGNPAAVSGSPYNTIDSSYVGEWLKIELPKAIKLSHVSIASRNAFASRQPPSKYRVYGSNNDSTWVQLIDADNVVYAEEVFTTKFSTTTNYYKYLALVIQKGTIDTGVTIGEIQYYGAEEPAPPGDLSLDTTLKSTFNSVRSNNYVMYFDGDGFIPGDNTSNNLVTDSNKSVIHHNATYDSTGKYWTLDGSTESNVTTGSLGLVGDAPHTVSTWINASNLDANATTQQLFSIGSGYSEEIIRVDDTQITANTWHNVTYVYQGEGGSKVTYVDGRKVKEETITDSWGRYPSVPIQNYSYNGYKVTSSSEYWHYKDSYPAWEVFNHLDNSQGDGWLTINAENYTGTNSVYSGTSRLSSGVDMGEWIKLEMPYKIYMDFMYITSPGVSSADTPAPKSYKVYGSNDDINWYQVLSRTNDPVTHRGSNDYHSKLRTADDKSKAYKYFALVVTQTNGYDRYTHVSELSYFGYKEGDRTRFPEPTRVLKYPHVSPPSIELVYGLAANQVVVGPAKRGYVASASSLYLSGGEAVYPAWEAFDHNTSANNRWASENAQNYNGGSFLYSGNKNLGTNNGGSGTPNGEWLMIEMPHKLKLQSTKLIANGNSLEVPDKFIIYGSNDLTGAWSVVDNTYETTSAAIPYGETGKTWTVSTSASPVAYKYFGLVIRNTTGSTYITTVNEWELYGTQEDTGTPAIVGGPFAGKVANFRVYDQYLGDERIQEIYDAQKDEFGHKKSSMTFYKGRVGVGTTEPEGALTVMDEPNTMEKIPSSNIYNNNSFIEGQGIISLSSANGDAYKAFDGNMNTVFESTIPSESSPGVDFGAWLKLETPETIKLKKAEFESSPYWRQVGEDIEKLEVADGAFGLAVACNHDGTRIIGAAPSRNSSRGRVEIYEFDGDMWKQLGGHIDGQASSDQFGLAVAMSGDGNTIAIGTPFEHADGNADSGSVRVYYLSASTWTILPDSGPHTVSVGASNVLDAFVGESVNDQCGQAVKLSYDGKTLAFGTTNEDEGGTDRGQVKSFTYANGAWSTKGSSINGDTDSQQFGLVIDMSEDGDHLIIGSTTSGTPKVKVYEYVGSEWALKGSAFTYSGSDGFGEAVAISNDGNVIALGIRNADKTDGARADNTGIVRMYHWSGSVWTLNSTLMDSATTSYPNDDFGTTVNLSGDGTRLIVSAPFMDPIANNDPGNSGQLWVYEYNGYQWVLRVPDGTGGMSQVGGQARWNHASKTSDQANAIGLLGETDSVLGTGVSNDRYKTSGASAGGQTIAISRDGSAIVAGEWAWNQGRSGDRGRVSVWSMPSNIKSIWGSDDNVTWTKLVGTKREDSPMGVAGKSFRVDDYLNFKNFDNSNYYKYHLIVADAYTRLKNVKLYGIRKQNKSILDDGNFTISKKVSAPIIESTGIINMKGDRTELRVNSETMMEFNKTTALVKYPTLPLTAAADIALGGTGYGGYRVTRSYANPSFPAWTAFNESKNNPGTVGWHTSGSAGQNDYNGTNGFYSGTERLAPNTELGEWIALELPEPIMLQRYVITPQGRPASYGNAPSIGIVYAKKTKLGKWIELHRYHRDGGASDFIADNAREHFFDFMVHSNEYYKYFALVIRKRGSSGGVNYAPSINELEYYGYPKPTSSTTDMALTIKSKPIVPPTGHLVVHYNARDSTSQYQIQQENSVSGIVTDVSGNNRVGNLYGHVQVDRTDGIDSFTYDGTYSMINVQNLGNHSGGWSHSFSAWFKIDVQPSGEHLFQIGNGLNSAGWGVENKYSAVVFYNTYTNWYGYSNDKSFKFVPEQNKWYHIAGVYYGDSTFEKRIFVNGYEIPENGRGVGGSVSSDSPSNLDANSDLTIGADYSRHDTYNSHWWQGCIADFRLYGRGLGREEILQLYEYEKEYFKHGKLGVTVKQGRIGVGTEHPMTPLDVRGPISGPFTTYISENETGTYVNYFNNGDNKLVLERTFNMPQEYNHLVSANMEMHVQINWIGEILQPWNAMFYTIVRQGNTIMAPKVANGAHGNRNSGVGVPTISYYHSADHNSTMEAASVVNSHIGRNLQTGPGSQITVELYLEYRGDAGYVTTNRTAHNAPTVDSNSTGHERAATNFFIAFKVV